MPDARARAIALCRRGFKPIAVVAWTKPGETPSPHPVAQDVLEAFFEHSARRYGAVDACLEALFADALDVGVLRAGVVYEDGKPVGLCRLDARLVPRSHRGFVGEPARGLVVFSVDVWEHIPTEKRSQMVAPLADPDADAWTLARLVRYLQGRCCQLLAPLLRQALAAEGIRGASARCQFTDPSQNPPKARGRPRVPAFMKNDPRWRDKAKALIDGRKRGRYWPVLLREAGRISQHTANKMIEEYEKEQRA